jgi:hypothetical protein
MKTTTKCMLLALSAGSLAGCATNANTAAWHYRQDTQTETCPADLSAPGGTSVSTDEQRHTTTIVEQRTEPVIIVE